MLFLLHQIVQWAACNMPTFVCFTPIPLDEEAAVSENVRRATPRTFEHPCAVLCGSLGNTTQEPSVASERLGQKSSVHRLKSKE